MDKKMFYVHIHYGANNRGYVGYNPETKELIVRLPEEEWVKKVTDYLTTEHDVLDATGLDTYENKKLVGVNSLEALKLALTRLWVATGVQVDWSRPVEFEAE